MLLFVIAMAATSASMKKLLPIILFLSTALLVTTAFAKSPPRLVAKLIHRDSIHSPYYNPNPTSLSYKRELRHSNARLAYLLGGAKTKNEDDYRAGVIADDKHTMFMANISFGEPPVPQLLLIDTGSNLLWLQCLPCTKCLKQFYPIFDPSKSSTYANMSCHSPYCFQNKCDPSDHCLYNETYFDGTTTIGNLVHEKLTVQTSDEGIRTISDFFIGCGHENVDTHANQYSGILGLGPQIALSLVYRLGNKFSYCIGSIRDPHYAFNNLIIGDGAKIEGNSSPLDYYDGLYYVRMEGISVGLKRLDINPDVFKRMEDKGGVFIDSGTTLTYLITAAYGPLRAEVQSLLNGISLTCSTDRSNHLCCNGNISRDLKAFPLVTFHFARGAALVLDIYSMFLDNGPRGFCMAVVEDPESVIGVMAQQSYNVAYDNHQHTISFQRIDCRLLESPKFN